MAQEDTIAPMPAYAYAILAAESQRTMAYCALALHLSGGRRGVLARMEDGRNDASEQASDYRRPPDPKAHLRKEGQINKLLGERRDHEIRTRDVVVSKNSIFPTQNRIQKWFDVTLAPLLAASADAMLAQCAWYLIPFHCC